ncbi:MAG TPA: hypothetical protein PKD63_06715 [Solirubrobacteraceae bacterium]|nr:hypothetical protein [Solirubrobacteraceae bacterium]
MPIRLISLAITLIVVLALAPAAVAAPTTYTVDSTGNGADFTPGDGLCAATGGCTLRAAIEESNASSGGVPHRINFFVNQISIPPGGLPAITRDGTFIDGCDVGFSALEAPNTPDDDPCVGLGGAGATTGLQVGSASTDPTDVAIYNLAMTNFPARAIHVWGADRTQIAGNLFGRTLTNVNQGNGAAVSVTGRKQGAVLANAATSTLIGGPSDATGDPADCNRYCNTIVGSTVTGIDLVGTGATEAPAGLPDGFFSDGTAISGNWIGVYTASGAAGPNEQAVKIGDAQDTTIGGSNPESGNVIAGNAEGVTQGSGTTATTLRWGVFGISPDGDTSVGNGEWNARLRGGGYGLNPFVENVTFGPAARGLIFDGSHANLLGSFFQSPDHRRFSQAAVYVGPDGDNAFIGMSPAVPISCYVPFADPCNTIGHTGPGAAGIWIDGASDARIWRNAIGGGLAAPIPGPPIFIGGGAVGADIGDNDDDPERRNILRRDGGPGIQVTESSTKIVIGGNEGLSVNDFDQPAGLFTDLLPAPGPGNSGTVNNGIQPPTVTVSSTTGVGGTGIPGATIHVLVQQRPPVVGDPDPNVEGYTFPSTPSTTTVAGDGIWGIAFDTPLKNGVKLLASQTTAADGSSEYASPLGASESNPPPIISFQSGPSGVVDTRSATFTFTANKPGTRLSCSVDGGAFVPCASPFTLNGLDIGGHQLQVKGTDPTGKVGPPASRTWIIQVAEPISPSGPPAAAARTVRFASVVTLPSAKRCVSRRTLRITVRAPKGAKVKSAEVRLRGRKVRTVRKAGTITVSLKGLPRGSFVVRVKLTLADGRTATGSRTYRTCAKKATKKKTKKR